MKTTASAKPIASGTLLELLPSVRRTWLPEVGVVTAGCDLSRAFARGAELSSGYACQSGCGEGFAGGAAHAGPAAAASAKMMSEPTVRPRRAAVDVVRMVERARS
jgi:hypothetical protein